MQLDLVDLPTGLADGSVSGRAVGVFDVLRATTTMTAALAAGVSEIRVFPTTSAAAGAAGAASPDRLLCGEEKCLPPPGFDLGNSPGAFTPQHAGRVMHMSTANGTRAIVACREARVIFAAALVNARAAARALLLSGLDVTLVCAGTSGEVAPEDLIGAGAVIDAMEREGADVTFHSDRPKAALRLYRQSHDHLRAALAATRGGQNVTRSGLPADVDFAARLDAFDVVGVIENPAAEPPVVRRASP